MSEGEANNAKSKFVKPPVQLTDKRLQSSTLHLSIKLLLYRSLISIFNKNRFLKIQYALHSNNNTLLNDRFARRHGILEIAYQLGMLEKPVLSQEFIQQRFNKNAILYDHIVTNENYNYYELDILVKALRHFISKLPVEKRKILDLGCGTGLVGRKLKSDEYEADLTGVDISKKMIEICKYSSNYSNVFESDISVYLNNNLEKYNIIVACSVIQFFTPDKLNELVRLSKSNLEDNGILIFTFDVCSKKEFQINQKLFGEHSVNLIEQIGNQNFNYVLLLPIKENRVENGKQVEGGLAIFSNSPIHY